MSRRTAALLVLLMAIGCSEVTPVKENPGDAGLQAPPSTAPLKDVQTFSPAASAEPVSPSPGQAELPGAPAPAALDRRGAAPGFPASCVLPRGEKGVTYAGTDVDEMDAWGPAAVTFGPDGHLWVADTAAHRILELDARCRLVRTIELPSMVGVTDLTVTASGVHVLDGAAQDPVVAVFSREGRELMRIPLDKPDSATGLIADARGAIHVEHGFGDALEEVIDEAGWITGRLRYHHELDGRSLRALPADMSAADASTGALVLDGRTIPVAVGHRLGGLRILGAAPAGGFYVLAEEVALEEILVVDRTVRRYDSSGRLTGLARVPVDEQYVHVEHGVAVGPDGHVYALLTREDHAELVRLAFADKLASIFDKAASAPEAEDVTPVAPPVTCVSRATIMSTGWAIRDNSKYLSSTNTDGACSGRGKPRYIGGAGTYRSVAYDWGGFSSRSQYNAAMSPGTGKAGDVNTAGVESCSYGLDCSGFVSRAWQKTTKYGTATLSQVSWQMSSTSSLREGDVMNKSGSHVVLFVSFATGGIWTLEATTTNSYDRVVYITRSWSALSGYVPRRLTGVCS